MGFTPREPARDAREADGPRASQADTRWVSRIPAGVLAAIALAQLALLFAVFAQRFDWPLDLEWMEGGTLTHALRVVNGEPIYGPPSLQFIPFLYTPLYPWLLALLHPVFGLGYPLGRGVSIASFLVLLALLWHAVAREGGGPVWRIAAIGALAAVFPLTDGFYDLVRSDTFFLALTLAGLVALRTHPTSARSVAVAACLLALAFLAKQTAAPFIVFGAGVLLLRAPRRLPLYVGAVALVDGGTVLWLNWRTAGWFWTTIFELHQQHDFHWNRLLGGPLHLLWSAPLLTLLPFAWLAWAAVARRAAPGGLYWASAALVAVFASALSWSTQWASLNAFMPGLVFSALFLGVGGAELSARLAGGTRGALPGAALALVVALQLGALAWSPAPHVPTRADRQRAERLLALLERLGAQGDLLVPYHPWYPVLVGRPPHLHHMGIRDFTRAGIAVPEELPRALAEGRYAAVVLDQPPDPRYGPSLARYHRRPIPAEEAPETFEGFRIRPRLLLTPDGR